MIAVRRLTGRARLAAVAGALALITPRALHDAAQLLPETFAAPLVMAAALAASRRAGSALGGALAVLAAAFKLAFVLPLAAIALAAASVRRYLAGAAASAIVLGAVFLITFGTEMTDSVIGDQRSLGFTELSKLPPLLAQAGWNLLPFTLPVLAAWVYRESSRDPQLMQTLAMAALGSLAVFVSIIKYGTYINLAVVAEPPLLALGAAGACVGLGRPRGARPAQPQLDAGGRGGGRARRPPGPDPDRRSERPVPLHPAAGARRWRLGCSPPASIAKSRGPTAPPAPPTQATPTWPSSPAGACPAARATRSSSPPGATAASSPAPRPSDPAAPFRRRRPATRPSSTSASRAIGRLPRGPTR